jgi:16S rRNA A1518/A1519 N6-dimethyltransferase RsmA/KsgA/DIM1 with predicted DNA glycosylase/AP lyase activity
VNNLLRMSLSLSRDEILRRLSNAGIPVNARPEELSVADFLRVYNLLNA